MAKLDDIKAAIQVKLNNGQLTQEQADEVYNLAVVRENENLSKDTVSTHQHAYEPSEGSKTTKDEPGELAKNDAASKRATDDANDDIAPDYKKAKGIEEAVNDVISSMVNDYFEEKASKAKKSKKCPECGKDMKDCECGDDGCKKCDDKKDKEVKESLEDKIDSGDFTFADSYHYIKNYLETCEVKDEVTEPKKDFDKVESPAGNIVDNKADESKKQNVTTAGENLVKKESAEDITESDINSLRLKVYEAHDEGLIDDDTKDRFLKIYLDMNNYE